MIMCSVRHAETLLHRARWKGGLHIYCNQQALICRPVVVICCAIPVQVCCSLRNCKWRLSPAYWATARKCAVEPTYISVRNSVRRPYSRLQSLTISRCGVEKIFCDFAENLLIFCRMQWYDNNTPNVRKKKFGCQRKTVKGYFNTKFKTA